jgi:hypothetical protein
MLWNVTHQREKMLNCRVVHAVALLLPVNEENVGEQHLLLAVVRALAAFTSHHSDECAQQVGCLIVKLCSVGGYRFNISYCFAILSSFCMALVRVTAGTKFVVHVDGVRLYLLTVINGVIVHPPDDI